MMSSSSAMALAPAHPETAEHEPAAVDHGHPQFEVGARPIVTDQCQSGDAETDGDEGPAEPETGHRVWQHEKRGPERVHFPRAEMRHADRPEQAERKEAGHRRDRPAVECSHAG